MRTKLLTKVVTVILAGKVNLLYDEFTDNRAAGAVNGTAAKPGAGVRYVTDPTDKISIATRILKLTSAGGWDISSLHYRQNDGSGYARAADTVLEFDLVSEGTTLQVIIGWFNSTTAVIANTEHTIFLASNRVYVRNATANSDIADMEEYILYRFRLVLQAAGCKFYVSGGDFGIFDKQYTLLHTDNTENTATLYPTLVNNTGGFDIDNVFAELIDDTPTAALDTALLTAITAWQGDAARIHTAGLNELDWAETSNVTGVDASGRTYISPTNAIMQYGYLRQIKVNVHARDGTAWKVKVFRYNYGDTDYDYISGEEFTPDDTGTYTHTLSAPIAVQPGDIPSLFIPDANNAVKVSDPDSRNIVMKVATGDIAATDNFAADHGDSNQFEVDCLTNRPYLCTVGCSVFAGKNHSVDYMVWHDNPTEPSWKSAPGGVSVESDIAYRLRSKIGTGVEIQYQNHSKGSIGFEWCKDTGVPGALAVQPKSLIIMTGINDIMTFGTTWAEAEGWLDDIKILFDASEAEKLFICEITPYTGASDAEAATIRTWNTEIMNWCSSNAATFIVDHKPMGQIRATTGYLDDLYTQFSQDGLHYTLGGVDKLADILAYMLMTEEV